MKNINEILWEHLLPQLNSKLRTQIDSKVYSQLWNQLNEELDSQLYWKNNSIINKQLKTNL